MKNYKVGDRIFYECDSDGCIYSEIVIEVKDEFYIDDKGKKIPYQWLTLWRDGNCSSGIENYSCLSSTDPKVKELAKKFARFDKQKDSIIESLLNIFSPWEKEIQEEIMELLKLKINASKV